MRNQLCGDDIKRGVCHADDLGYIFHKQGQKKQPLDSAEYLDEFAFIQRRAIIMSLRPALPGIFSEGSAKLTKPKIQV